MTISGYIIRTKKDIMPEHSIIKSEKLITSYLVLMFDERNKNFNDYVEKLKEKLSNCDESVDDCESSPIIVDNNDGIRIRVEHTIFKTTIYKSLNVRFYSGNNEVIPMLRYNSDHKIPGEGLFHKFYTYNELENKLNQSETDCLIIY